MYFCVETQHRDCLYTMQRHSVQTVTIDTSQLNLCWPSLLFTTVCAHAISATVTTSALIASIRAEVVVTTGVYATYVANFLCEDPRTRRACEHTICITITSYRIDSIANFIPWPRNFRLYSHADCVGRPFNYQTARLLEHAEHGV